MGELFSAGKNIVFYLLILATIIGCGSGGIDTATTSSSSTSPSTTPTTTGGTTAAAAAIGISSSPVVIKSGNVETSTITATVVDADNAAVKNLVVIFSATGGQLSDSSATTDDKGEAKITFSSGIINPGNRVVTITAKASGAPSASIPVTISGSTVTMVTDKTNLTSNGGTSLLNITAKDALGTAIYNAPITLSVNTGGILTLSSSSGNTNELGQYSVTVTGVGAGTATVTASGLGTSASQAYVLNAPATVFEINKPANIPYSQLTTDTFPVTVKAQNYAHVRFATTLGAFTGGEPVVDKDVVGGVVSTNFSSSKAGLATIQVWGFNGAAPTNDSATDSLQIAVSAPASAAAILILQSSSYVVTPSVGGVQNRVKLSATVQTSEIDGRQPVRDAPVAFSITGLTSGGGEAVSPVVVYTDDKGQAISYFQSGTLSSGTQGISVQAQVVGTAIKDIKQIIIGGTPGSVAIGLPTEIENVDSATYRMLVAVQVADSNGNSIRGQAVSLNLWPVQCSSGLGYDSNPDPDKYKYAPYIIGTFPNEDTNEDMYNNVGEDVNLNGRLDPPNSAAGTIPQSVITDENGRATFYLYYLKNNAVWIVDRIRASVLALGTETTSSVVFRLPILVADMLKPGLPDSPFPLGLVVRTGGSSISYSLPPPFNTSSSYSTIPSGGTSSVTAAGLYTFTKPAGALTGSLYTDTITIDTLSYGTLYLPVTIAIQ